jgi:hypothetical protein
MYSTAINAGTITLEKIDMVEFHFHNEATSTYITLQQPASRARVIIPIQALRTRR